MADQQSSPLPPSVHIALIGDSDIARWPKELLPSIDGATISVTGFSGATLDKIVPHVEQQQCPQDNGVAADIVVLVICAGENDIGDGYSLHKSEESFTRLLDVIYNRSNRRQRRSRLIFLFLGPKLEPWLEQDADARKKYVNMSRSFERLCKDRNMSELIAFVDCLVMFCGASGKQPGAILGGKAKAEPRYFQPDQLHLCNFGYAIWKSEVEDRIQAILSNIHV